LLQPAIFTPAKRSIIMQKPPVFMAEIFYLNEFTKQIRQKQMLCVDDDTKATVL
jgi:hypothetical protein